MYKVNARSPYECYHEFHSVKRMRRGENGIHYLRSTPSYYGEVLSTGGTQTVGGTCGHSTISGKLVAETNGSFGLGEGSPNRSLLGPSNDACAGPGSGGG